MLLPASEPKTSSSCVYTVVPFDTVKMDSRFSEMSKLGTQVTSYTAATIKTDETQKATFSQLKGKYVEVSVEYKEKACGLLNLVDRLFSLRFPEEWRGNIETLPCLMHSYSEQYVVQECHKQEGFLNCDLEIGLPTVIKGVKTVIPLNYDGYQLYAPEGHTWAIKLESQQLVQLSCHMGMDWNSHTMPLCKVIPVQEPCMTSLLSSEISMVLDYCKFGKSTFPKVTRLADDGVLIMGGNARIREEGRNIPQKPPLVIYTNNNLNIEVDGETFIFTNKVNIKYPQQSFTRLDSTQIATLVSRGSWEDMKRETKNTDYMQYSLIMLESLMAPLTIAMSILTCIRARWCKCKRAQNGDIEMGGQQLENIPLRAMNRRMNFDRNRALLQEPRN